jgi:hypothetical protein
MEDLSDAVASLQYLVARPGTFSTFYPETTDDMVVSVLVDALAECHLEGLLLDTTSDEDGFMTPALADGQVALVVLFAAVRFLRGELINRNTAVTYKAGSAEYTTSQSTNILRDILAGLLAQRASVIAAIGTTLGGAGTAFAMADQFLIRSIRESGHHGALEGLIAYPLTGIGW